MIRLWQRLKFRFNSFLENWKVILDKKEIKSLNNTPLYQVLKAFLTGLNNGWITMRASAITFNFFMALPPMFLFAITLIPYFQMDGLYSKVFLIIEGFVPDKLQGYLFNAANEIINVSHTGLLSFSFLLIFIFASNGFLGILNAFNSSIQETVVRSWFKQQLIAIFLFVVTIVMMIFIAVSINLNGLLNQIYDMDNRDYYGFLKYFIKIIAIILVCFFVYFEVWILFYFGVVGKREFTVLSLPSFITTILIVILSIGFNIYVTNFARYNILYGSIGTIMLFMLWLYVNAIILIVGFELHIAFVKAKKGELCRTKTGELTDDKSKCVE